MRYIIFDIDGTLTDTTSVDDDCFIAAFRDTYQIDLQNENWSRFENVTDWGITEQVLTEHLGKVPDKAAIRAMIPRLAELLQSEYEKDTSRFSPVPGADTFLNLLNNDNNSLIGIATGAWEASARIKLESAGIHYQNLPFSNSNHHKSREKIVQSVIDELDDISGSKENEVIYFGDGVWDYKTCKKLNIRFAGIDAHRNGKLKSIGASRVFEDFTNVNEIMGWIENGNLGDICF